MRVKKEGDSTTDQQNAVADPWYDLIALDHGISLIREIHVASWLRCNMWLVPGRDHDLLVDTGMGLRPLKQEIAQLRDKPLITISTHCHFDHMGGAHEFDCRLGHRLEGPIHADPEIENSEGYGPFVRAETFSALPYAGFSHEDFRVKPAPLTGYLDEGDVVDLGDRWFSVLHVPGHSPGSIALYEEKTRTLFSGDLLYDGLLIDTIYNSNLDHYRESLLRLKSLPIEVVHGGHYRSFDQNRMIELIDRYLDGEGSIADDYAWVEEQIRNPPLWQ